MALTDKQAQTLDAARKLRVAGNPYMTQDMIAESHGDTLTKATLNALVDSGHLDVAYMVTEKGMAEGT